MDMARYETEGMLTESKHTGTQVKTSFFNSNQCAKHPGIAIKKGRSGKYYCPKCRRNSAAREKNAVLRELCGTSAAAARRDMGL